jgi:GAF domain-containing protein
VNVDGADLRQLFHTLNNQLGIILSHAELLEAKAQDDAQRARATQVVTTTLEALTTARQIRHTIEPVGL